MGIITSKKLSKIEGLIHGFTDRNGGMSEPPYNTLNLGLNTGDLDYNVGNNYKIVASEIGVDSDSFFTASQVHGKNIVIVGPLETRESILKRSADALLTKSTGKLVGVTVADCVPVLIVDPVLRAVAAVHCGWRSLAEKILFEVVETMIKRWGSDPKDLIAAIGPSIRGCCYVIKKDVAKKLVATVDLKLKEYYLTPEPAGDLFKVDLATLALFQLYRCGLQRNSIEVLPYCTYCRPELFFSYRRNPDTGRHLAFCGFIV